ncbi:LYR motif-containing protein 5A [Penicillium longicatenatum]|nr:LYR motif-containing protein 5A [Penicillium longicatenatum]
MVAPELRQQVINVYKGMSQKLTENGEELLWLGREYPLGYKYFRDRLHRAFAGQAHLQDEEQIRKGIARAEFVKKGSYWSAVSESSPIIVQWLIYVILQKSKHCKINPFPAYQQ